MVQLVAGPTTLLAELVIRQPAPVRLLQRRFIY